MSSPDGKHDYLRRLSADNYKHNAVVHWINTIDDRSQGWLTESFHQAFREILLHTCARYKIACAAYCLMPDHFHLLLVNHSSESDQRTAQRFLRKQINRLLADGNFSLQKQAYDHVLRDQERTTDGFAALLHYIRENPVRSEHAHQADAWPYSGAMIAGYPDIDPAEENFAETFWKLVELLRDQHNPL